MHSHSWTLPIFTLVFFIYHYHGMALSLSWRDEESNQVITQVIRLKKVGHRTKEISELLNVSKAKNIYGVTLVARVYRNLLFQRTSE